MADSVTTLPRRGQTLLTGTGRTLGTSGTAPAGAQKDFAYYTTPTTPGAIMPAQQAMTTCILVRNRSGIALLPKRIVKWKSGSEGKEVDGYCAVDFECVAGVVDEHLPAAGVPANDLFWIAVKGPSLVLTDLANSAANVHAVGRPFTALTAATSQATTAGRAQAFAVTTTVTSVMSIAFNKIGRAMSAKTTNQTNADLLVNLDIWA